MGTYHFNDEEVFQDVIKNYNETVERYLNDPTAANGRQVIEVGKRLRSSYSNRFVDAEGTIYTGENGAEIRAIIDSDWLV